MENSIEERAKAFATSDIKTGLGTVRNHVDHFRYEYYLQGAKEQQKIDIEKAWKWIENAFKTYGIEEEMVDNKELFKEAMEV